MKSEKSIQWGGYLCLLPLAILVAVFLLNPLLNGFYLSFFATKYGFGDLRFAGFLNYISMSKVETFGISIRNSLIWVSVSTVLNMIFPLFLAIMLNREFKGRQFVIAGLLIPWITPVIGFSMMNKWLLEPDVGILNGILKDLGIISQGINFLGRTDLALPTLIILNFWQFAPFGVLMLSSALSVIPEEQYDAMKVDGAKWRHILTNLILPSVGSMIGFMMFLGTVQTFNNYSLINMLTKGGPSRSTYTIPVLIYEKAFLEFNVGQSCALASTVGMVIIILGIYYFKNIYKVES